MPSAYYAALESGDSWIGATLHTKRDCTDEHLTPLSGDVIDTDETTWCGECGPHEDVGTCDEVKSDGEVCGRDLPCPYHD